MIVCVPTGSDEVVQLVNHSVPPPASNDRFEQPGITVPSLSKVTVPPPSVGFTSAVNLADWPESEVAEDSPTVVELAVR